MYYHRHQASFTRKDSSASISENICRDILNDHYDSFKLQLDEHSRYFNSSMIDHAVLSPNLKFIHYMLLSSDPKIVSVLRNNYGHIVSLAQQCNKPLYYAIINGYLETSLGETNIGKMLGPSDQVVVAQSEEYAILVVNAIANKIRAPRGWNDTRITDFEIAQQCISLGYSYETYYPLLMVLLKKAERDRQVFYQLLGILIQLAPEEFNDREGSDSAIQIMERLCNMTRYNPVEIIDYILQNNYETSPNFCHLEEILLSRGSMPVSSKLVIGAFLLGTAIRGPAHKGIFGYPDRGLTMKVRIFNGVYTYERFLRYPIRILQHLISNVDDEWEIVNQAIQNQYRGFSKKLAKSVPGLWYMVCYRRFVALHGIKFIHAPEGRQQTVSITLKGMARHMTDIGRLIQDILSGNVATHLHYLPDNLVQNMKMILMIRRFESTILSHVPNEVIFEICSHFLVF